MGTSHHHSARVISSKDDGNGGMVVVLRLSDVPDDDVRYIAAAPPDYRASFAGSGMPFSGVQQAFHNTPNLGRAALTPGSMELEVRLPTIPNSYYVGLGTIKIPPTLHMSYTSNGTRYEITAQVGNPVPFRSLTYPMQRSSASSGFYSPEAALVRSQEQILRDGAYPEVNREPSNFWGARPPR